MATGSSSSSRDIVMINWVIYDERRSMPLGVLRMIDNNCCGEGTVAAIPWELLPQLGRGWW